MKKNIIAAIGALSVVLVQAAPSFAQQRDRDAKENRIERSAPQKQQVKKQSWKKGGKYSGRGNAVSNHGQHGLRAPSKGQRWVRDGDNFLLVVTATGVIASVVSGASR